jgi:PAS domain S-box-containing protein
MIRVLHVDDEATDHELIRYKLNKYAEDISLQWVNSVDNAISELEQGEIDCVLSDYQMPGRNGMELLQEIQQAYSRVPFIFLTGQGNERLAVEALRNGAVDYFTKNESFAQYARLINSIRSAVSSKRIEQEKNSYKNSLIESEQKWRAYIENCPIGFFVANKKGRHQVVNSAACEMLGYTRDELLQLTVFDLRERPSDDIRQHFESLPISGQIKRIARLKKKDGSRLPVLLEAVKVRDDQFMAYFSDISEQQRTEAQIKSMNSLFHVMNRINQLILTSPDISQMLNKACLALVADRKYAGCSIFLRTPDGLKCLAGAGEENLQAKFGTEIIAEQDIPHCIQDAISEKSANSSRQSECLECRVDKNSAESPDAATVCLPMRQGDDVIGVLFVSIDHAKDQAIDDEIAGLLQQIADNLSMAWIHHTSSEKEQLAIEMLHQAEEMAGLGSWMIDLETQKVTASQNSPENLWS